MLNSGNESLTSMIKKTTAEAGGKSAKEKTATEDTMMAAGQSCAREGLVGCTDRIARSEA